MLRLLVATFLILTSMAAPARAGGDWNDANVKWVPYEKAIVTATQEKKPILLVVFTEWCPHCTNYSQVFHDAKVVEESKKFVMVRVDKDKQPEVSRTYAPDGEYIPRTYFLTSDGTLSPDIHAPRPKYKYFYDEKDPAAILGGMNEALKKIGTPIPAATQS